MNVFAISVVFSKVTKNNNDFGISCEVIHLKPMDEYMKLKVTNLNDNLMREIFKSYA